MMKWFDLAIEDLPFDRTQLTTARVLHQQLSHVWASPKRRHGTEVVTPGRRQRTLERLSGSLDTLCSWFT
jgi:hypothetical protein